MTADDSCKRQAGRAAGRQFAALTEESSRLPWQRVIYAMRDHPCAASVIALRPIAGPRH
jgi:hypothetical protein